MAENIFEEVGTPGLESWSGVITKAYTSELRWPGCYPIYSRIRRSDPEMTIVRIVFATFGRQARLQFTPGENASDDDKKFAEFGNQVLEDIEGGQAGLIESTLSHTPFYGWSWFEALPGLRASGWKAPEGDPWESEFDDGLIGIRRMAFRDQSSFDHWEITDRGRLKGMWQMDVPHPPVMIPLDRSLHLTFGDTNNPEGLTPLESIYRLERVKYALELIQGIGYEHAAGYLEVRSTKDLTPADKVLIKQMARAVLTAQEANYAAWPSHLTGEIKDITFAAGGSILEAIRYYSMLKLQVYLMQWVAMATTSGAGAYSAVQDTSGMFLNFFSAMLAGFASQIDAQVGKRLYRWNADKFPGITRRPRITIPPIGKQASTTDLSTLISSMVDELGPEDWIAIRKATGLLSANLKENQSGYEEWQAEKEKNAPPPPPAPTQDADPNTDTEDGDQAQADQDQVRESAQRFRHWAKEHDPDTAALLEKPI